MTLLFFAATLAAAVAIDSREVPSVVETNLENIPMKIGKYSAVRDFFPQSVYDELDADRHVYRHYHPPSGPVIDLYIGYYGTAKGGRTPHNPYACLPGAGWGIVNRENVNIAPGFKPGTETVKLVTTRKGDIYKVMLHWYQAAGTRVLSSGLEQNVHRFLSRVLYNRNDGAYIQISTNTDLGNIEAARTRLKAFAEKMFPLLPEYWPVEK
jgi:EpsI family protein